MSINQWYRMGDKLLHAVTITAATRHGRTKLHTFTADGDAWVYGTMPTRKQFEAHRRELAAGQDVVELWERRSLARHPDMGVPYGVGLAAPDSSEPAIHLARGVDVTHGTLAVILDALRSGERHEVDIHDIKVVVSQLGSEIARLFSLPSELRRHAEQALYTEILRCTNL
jgi:hypothetical protein